MLFHITEQTTWKTAQTLGVYRPASLETEGFIHLSEQTQVLWVANQFYQGQTGLLLLGIAPDRLKADLRYDAVPGHGTFPHLYGELNLDAVIQTWDFSANGVDGFTLPPLDTP